MAVLNRVCANNVDTAVGRVVYTQWLDERGGIIADVTVTRQAEDQYVVISGDNIHRRVPAWIRRQTREGEFVTVTDVTSGYALLSVQGPRSRELLQRLSPDDWSERRVPVPHRAEGRARLHPALGAAGDLRRRAGLGPAGADRVRRHAVRPDPRGRRRPGLPADRRRRAVETMRLEKAFRDMGHDIDSTDTPLEAGLGFAVAWDKPGGFVGREALLKQRESGPLTSRLVNVLLELARPRPVRRRAGLLGRRARRPRPQRRFRLLAGRRVRHRRDRAATRASPPPTWPPASFEIDVAGTRVPAQVSLKPFFDPERSRILA